MATLCASFMGFGLSVLFFLVLPAFIFITTYRTPGVLLSMIAVLAACQAMSGAVGIIALPECFPRAVRTSGMSVTYALAVTIFGGSAQFVVTWLLAVTKNELAIAWYSMAANAISIVALFYLRPPDARLPLE